MEEKYNQRVELGLLFGYSENLFLNIIHQNHHNPSHHRNRRHRSHHCKNH